MHKISITDSQHGATAERATLACEGVVQISPLLARAVCVWAMADAGESAGRTRVFEEGRSEYWVSLRWICTAATGHGLMMMPSLQQGHRDMRLECCHESVAHSRRLLFSTGVVGDAEPRGLRNLGGGWLGWF